MCHKSTSSCFLCLIGANFPQAEKHAMPSTYLSAPSPGWHNHSHICCPTTFRETPWTEELHFVQSSLYKMRLPAVMQTHRSDDSNLPRTTTVSAPTWKEISPSHWCSCVAVLYIHLTTESLMKTDIARRIKEVKRFRWI